MNKKLIIYNYLLVIREFLRTIFSRPGAYMKFQKKEPWRRWGTGISFKRGRLTEEVLNNWDKEVKVACSKRSDIGERCEVKKAIKSRGGLGREVRELLPRTLPSFYFSALLFTSQRSPLSERLEQAKVKATEAESFLVTTLLLTEFKNSLSVRKKRVTILFLILYVTFRIVSRSWCKKFV